MINNRAKGGNVKAAQSAAKVNIAEKSALVAIPVPIANVKPKVFKASNINEAISNLNVSFKVKQTKLDGSSSHEEIKVTSLDDFEEGTIAQNSSTLRAQQQQMNFLHDFQNEIKTNPALRAEIKIMLESENKEKLLTFLKGWIKQFKKPEQQFLQILQSNFSN